MLQNVWRRWRSDKKQVAARRRARPWHRDLALEYFESRRMLSLTPPVGYTIGAQADSFIPNAVPIDVATADLNGDGKLDLVETHRSDNSVYILLGNGNGSFQNPVKYAVLESIQGDVFIADLNNDGKLDLFLPSLDSSGNVHPIIVLGNGNGTFQAHFDSSSFANGSRGWAVADFNGDGKLDLVDTNPVAGKESVLLGNGNGTFQAAIVGPQLFSYSRWVTTGDVNGDGKVDLLIADGQGYNDQPATDGAELTVLFGNGDATFRLGGHYASKGTPKNEHVVTNPEDVTVADVNRDGKLDAIVSDYDHNINVFINNGNGTFQPAIGIDPGQYPRGVAAGDVNGDGKIDLLVTNGGVGPGGNRFILTGEDEPGSVALLAGNGDGTFQSPISYGTSAFPEHAVLGDFDGNGLLDVAVTQVRDGHTLNVLLNRAPYANLPPTIVAGVAAPANPVTANATSLSVLGADDSGEAGLTYNWSAWTTINGVDAPAAVTFGANHSNAAKNVIATFPSAGGYSLRVAVTDVDGMTAWSILDVNVNQTLTSISVAPGALHVPNGTVQQFTATANDQFGVALATKPTFTWSIDAGGVGAVSATGLYTAPASGNGTATLRATSGGVSGTASLLKAAAPYQNAANPLDVNNSGGLTPLDAILIINALNLSGSRPLPPPSGTPAIFFDVDGDNFLAPVDAILVINALNTALGQSATFAAAASARTSQPAASSAALTEGIWGNGATADETLAGILMSRFAQHDELTPYFGGQGSP